MPGSLGDLLLELLAMPCVTGEEGPIADWLARRYRAESVRRFGNSVVVGSFDDPRPTVLLVGHTDVVPPTDADRRPRREGGHIVGRGASDMKAGLAVGLDCFEDATLRAGGYNLVLVAYAGEEGAHEGNELAAVLREVPRLAAAALAVVLEPTDLTVQLGCLGALHAEVTVRGRAAHAARPWQGDNAITKAAGLLGELGRLEPEDRTVDGLVYREVCTVTQAWTANARNVVPDRFTINLNYRFAPDRSVEEASQRLRALIGEQGSVTVVDRAPPGRPHRKSPAVRAFLAAVAAPVEPKQAWTDVARFSQAGVPALNYGPGLTAQAHQAGEFVPEANLDVARERLTRFLSAPAVPA